MERTVRQPLNRAALRIDVDGDDAVSPQARTYAEYRVFAALTQSAATRDARSARVVLRHLNPHSECGDVACVVTVHFGASTMRVRAFGAHAYAAINRGVECLRAAAARDPAERIPQDGS
jgi:hypothetical protein